MSNVYTPNNWRIIRIEYPGQYLGHRIMCSWYGGYTSGDRWKLSSGIQAIDEYPDKYVASNRSGSIYHLYKANEGWSGYGLAIFENLIAESPNVILTPVSIEDIHV